MEIVSDGSGCDYSTRCYGDIFVCKFNSTGSSLLYSTYIGGEGGDACWGLDIKNNNAYITGRTYSTTYPVTSGAYSTTGRTDGQSYLTILNSTGTNLIYSSYLPGDGGSIIVSGNYAYICSGSRRSTDATTSGAYQTILRGGGDGYLRIINPAGNGNTDLVYATLLGGNSDEYLYKLKVIGNYVYLLGTTFRIGNPSFP